MSKKDRIEFNLDFIKKLIFALLSALFAIFAFIVVYFESINTLKLIVCVFGIVILGVFLAFALVYMRLNLRKLEEL